MGSRRRRRRNEDLEFELKELREEEYEDNDGDDYYDDFWYCEVTLSTSAELVMSPSAAEVAVLVESL